MVLQDLLLVEEEELLDAVDDLLALRIIQEDMDTDEEYYKFENTVLWDLIYNEQSRSRQRVLHLKVGEVMERYIQTSPGDQVFELVHHFDKGKEYIKALRYGIQAGDLATSSKAFIQAQKYFTIALEAYEELPTSESEKMKGEYAHLLEGSGGASMVLGDWKKALKCYTRILKKAQKEKELRKQMDAHLNIGFIKKMQGEWSTHSRCCHKTFQV